MESSRQNSGAAGAPLGASALGRGGSQDVLLNPLRLDARLAAAVPPSDRERAADSVRVRAYDLPPGPWAPRSLTSPRPHRLGLLVLEGHLLRAVAMAGGHAAEMLGPGDLLRPWDDDTTDGPLAVEVEWTVLTRARLAVLDSAFAPAVAAWPELATEVVSRVLHRARCQSALLAISHIPRLEPRIVAVLWHLADRFGHVEDQGVAMPLRLSHETLGSLVGARRPSVSRSLPRLVRAGLLTSRPGGGWWVHGDAAAAIEACGNPGYEARGPSVGPG